MTTPRKYRVWDCKIVVAGDETLPQAFDGPPRQAAIAAVEKHGISVIGCFSGWAGELTPGEQAVVENTDNIPE